MKAVDALLSHWYFLESDACRHGKVLKGDLVLMTYKEPERSQFQLGKPGQSAEDRATAGFALLSGPEVVELYPVEGPGLDPVVTEQDGTLIWYFGITSGHGEQIEVNPELISIRADGNTGGSGHHVTPVIYHGFPTIEAGVSAILTGIVSGYGGDGSGRALMFFSSSIEPGVEIRLKDGHFGFTKGVKHGSVCAARLISGELEDAGIGFYWYPNGSWCSSGIGGAIPPEFIDALVALDARTGAPYKGTRWTSSEDLGAEPAP